MPRFAANVSMMFAELPVAERFAAARKAGFQAVEYLAPYADPIAEVRRWIDDAGVEMILLNTLPGDAEAGERGLAALPGREADFREHFEQALAYATGLGAGMIHVMAGVVPDGIEREDSEATFVANLRRAAPEAARHDIALLLEPLNTVDMPGYLHTRCDQTRRIIEAAAQPNVRLQYDFYHRQVMEGNLAPNLRQHFDLVGHIQFSSLPGRHEPQHGEVNMPFLFDVVDSLGYDGWIGCEYSPKAGTLEGLSWGRPWGLGGSGA